MSSTWLNAPTGKAAELTSALAALVPMLTTERLRLRAPTLADYPAYRDVFTTHRSVHMDGPFTEPAAYADFCEAIAGWFLRGAGMWTLTLKDDDAPLGWIYLWQEKGDPEPELGWVLTEAAEGRGYAAEASRAVLPLAVAMFGASGFVSYIDAANDRSARLALALGAVRDPKAEAVSAALGEVDLHVYRHSGKGVAL